MIVAVASPVLGGCCNPRPWQPICVGCPGRVRSGNPYAHIDGVPVVRPAGTVDRVIFKPETLVPNFDRP